MALETIVDGEYAKIPMGCYPCVFNGRTQFTSKKGEELYRWEFTMISDGKTTITGIGGSPKVIPSTNNKLGKWMCALEGKPATAGQQIDVNQCIGRKYQVLVDGDGKMTGFSPILANI